MKADLQEVKRYINKNRKMHQISINSINPREQTSTSQESNSSDSVPKRNRQTVKCPKQKVRIDILFITLIILELLMILVEERPFLSRVILFLIQALIFVKVLNWICSTFCQKPDDNSISFIDIHQNSCTPAPSSIESDSHILNLNLNNMSNNSGVSSPVYSELQLSSCNDLPPYHIALTLPQPQHSSFSLPDRLETPPPSYENLTENMGNNKR